MAQTATERAGQAGPNPAQELRLELAQLCDALDLLHESAFLFAVCEQQPLRERLIQYVREHLAGAAIGRTPVEVVLSPEQPDLAAQLQGALLYAPSRRQPAESGVLREQPLPPVVFCRLRDLDDAGIRVAGLPAGDPARVRAERARRTLQALNLQRERLSRLDVPLVFWLSQRTLGQVAHYAADVYAARGGLFYLETPQRAPTDPPPVHAQATADLLDRFDRTLLPPDELRRRAALYERRLQRLREAPEPHWPGIAALCKDLAHIYQELDDYRQAGVFWEQAIEAYERAIALAETGERGTEWALLYVSLGLAYYSRPTEERGENLARAIECYQEALRFYTPEAAPYEYAMTQNNLGVAYGRMPTGDRGENLARAIECFQEALRFRTPEAAPHSTPGNCSSVWFR